MTFNDYLDSHNEWKSHLEGNFIRKMFALPDKIEWAEQIFSQQPKTHQQKYSEERAQVEVDVEKLKQFFNGFHEIDLSNGKYSKILKNSRDSLKARMAN